MYKLCRFALIVFLSIWSMLSEACPDIFSEAGIPSIICTGDYPQDYFQLPVARDVKLSGTFGELRPNHFHMGLDVKSLNGSSGENIQASAGGYIARIKVEPGGYGRAIYIAHPNGYTTVYAHLDRFRDDIAEFVKSKQYELQRFSVDLHPPPNMFEVDQGEYFAHLGNSGGSFGPHVHFEIRRSAGQVPINPMLFGLPVYDKVRPELRSLKVYHLNDHRQAIQVEDYSIAYVKSGKYVIKDTLMESAWRIGFGVKAHDQMNGTPNKNGIFRLEMYIDNIASYAFSMEEIPYSRTRYINAHMDYAARVNRQGYFHKCYRLPGNNLDIYDDNSHTGVVDLYRDRAREVKIRIADALDNISELTFYVRRDAEMTAPESKPYHYKITYTEPYSIDHTDCSLVLPSSTFYEDTYLSYSNEETDHGGIYSDLHTIGTDQFPMHQYATISIRGNIPPALRPKAVIAKLSGADSKKLINCGGTIEGDKVTTRVRELGTYCISVDTIPPTIIPVSFSQNMTGASRMQFKIDDDMPTGGRARGLRHTASVDGQWILMEYDAKNDLLTHTFDAHIGKGMHTLEIRVTDDRKNTMVLRKQFTR